MRMKVSAEMDVVKEILGRMSKLPIKQKRLEDGTLRNLAIDAYRCCRKVLTVPSDFGAYCEEEIGVTNNARKFLKATECWCFLFTSIGVYYCTYEFGRI